MDGKCGGADATFHSHERDELALDRRNKRITLFARHLNKSFLDAVGHERFFEVFRAAGTHRFDDGLGVHAAGRRKDREWNQRGSAKVLDSFERQLAVAIKIDNADLRMDLTQRANKGSILFAKVLLKRGPEGEARHRGNDAPDEMDGLIVHMNCQ